MELFTIGLCVGMFIGAILGVFIIAPDEEDDKPNWRKGV